MNRLTDCLSQLRSRKHKAMGIFVTCGFPTIDDTVPLMHAIDRGGADFIELGMPFSDPLAEGKPIQHSSEVALANGVNLSTAFAAVRSFRDTSETPVLLMGYVNPILKYGEVRFCREAAAVGVDGLILPDLPPEEAAGLAKAADEHGLSMVYLIAPNTPPERVRKVGEMATGFVYAVSFTGLTGAQLDTSGAVQEYLEQARAMTQQPLLVGFGIGNAEDAGKMTRHTDGFIVGSALVGAIDAVWSNDLIDSGARTGHVESFVRGLRAEKN